MIFIAIYYIVIGLSLTLLSSLFGRKVFAVAWTLFWVAPIIGGIWCVWSFMSIGGASMAWKLAICGVPGFFAAWIIINGLDTLSSK